MEGTSGPRRRREGGAWVLTCRSLAMASVVKSILAAGAIVGVVLLAGCQAFGVFAVMADAYERTGSSTIPAQYDGLRGKRVAVVVYTDMATAMDDPELITRVGANVSAVLAGTPEAGIGGEFGGGVINPMAVRNFQVSNPSWPAWSFGDIAKALGAERLVWVEIHTHRLHEPGNDYTFAGTMAGRVAVVESGEFVDEYVDDFAFESEVAVRFPDGEGYTKGDLTSGQVRSVLEKRFIDRVTWLFFEHEEANMIEY